MRLTLVIVIILSAVSVLAGGKADVLVPTVWLPIVATRTSVSDALNSAAELGHNVDELQIVKTNDCSNLSSDLFIVVAGVHNTRSAAELEITKWRKRGVADAYLRICKALDPSRVSLRIPLLDQSFMHQPIDAVNWDIEDAVSHIVVLSKRLIALIIPRYQADPEDIREGLRIGVRLYILDENRTIDLSSDCIDPEFVYDSTHIAITCINETAATHLLHRTQLFSLAGGKVVAEKSRCTKPKFLKDHWVCQEESVDAEGELELKPTVLHISHPKQ
jgi:hypothetical protein